MDMGELVPAEFPFPLAEPEPEPMMITRPCGCTSMVIDGKPAQVSWCVPHDPGYEAPEPPPPPGRNGSLAMSVYRCAECKHGRHLTAWGNASVCGPLGADGEIDSYDWDDLWEVHEESIQCTRHPDAVIEKRADGLWCRWWSCFMCGGTGRRGSLACPAPSPIGKHEGWRPAAETSGSLVWPGLGAGHVLDQDLRYYRPGSDAPNCRICGTWADSIAGREPCKGDVHRCPEIVSGPEASPDALQRFGRDDWFCGRPGSMSKDFTSWTCTAGHACRAVHAENEAAHKRCIPGRGCPWKYLAREKASARCAGR